MLQLRDGGDLILLVFCRSDGDTSVVGKSSVNRRPFALHCLTTVDLSVLNKCQMVTCKYSLTGRDVSLATRDKPAFGRPMQMIRRQGPKGSRGRMLLLPYRAQLSRCQKYPYLCPLTSHLPLSVPSSIFASARTAA